MNKISFIIPVYNEVKTVRKSINDVINLKIQDKEIISNISEDEINKQFDYKYHTKNIDTIFKRVFEN